MNDYKFLEPPTTACISCKHITKEHKPVLFVSHDNGDGGWQFLCGSDSHTDEDGSVVGLGSIAQYDKSLNDIADMPLGVCAERKGIDLRWEFFRIS